MIRALIFVLLFASIHTFAQSDSTITLNRLLKYYDNGNFKELITYNLDTCEYSDIDNNVPAYKDCCRDGIYKTWYFNGQLKVYGQYNYELWVDTIISIDPHSGQIIYNTYPHMQSYRTGLWYNYDSIGSLISASRYINDKEVAVKYKTNTKILKTKKDSIWIKLDDYDKVNCYVINRSQNCKNLILQFPIHSKHNYWKIYDYQIDLLLDDYFPNSLYYWPEGIADLTYDDCCGKQNYFDFGHLQSDTYYVYYWSYLGTFHEIEIIIYE